MIYDAGGKCVELKPIRDRIIVKRLEEEAAQPSGLVIPETAKEKAQVGEVMQTGEGSLRPDGSIIPLAVKAGDRILFSKYSGVETKIGAEEFLILREDDILAILPGDDPTVIKG
jgi:chaperonin GroES